MPLIAPHRQPKPDTIATWFASDAGQALLACEADVLQTLPIPRTALPSLWVGPRGAGTPLEGAAVPAVHLHTDFSSGFDGAVRCALPLPFADDACGAVILQHVEDNRVAPALLAEAMRVLVPGGRLWLLVLNPFSPYRLRWQGCGLHAREPVTWRRRLREVGFVPDSLTRGLGPSWAPSVQMRMQDGVGLRAAYVLSAQKRQWPVTPLRAPPALRWAAGSPA